MIQREALIAFYIAVAQFSQENPDDPDYYKSVILTVKFDDPKVQVSWDKPLYGINRIVVKCGRMASSLPDPKDEIFVYLKEDLRNIFSIDEIVPDTCGFFISVYIDAGTRLTRGYQKTVVYKKTNITRTLEMRAIEGAVVGNEIRVVWEVARTFSELQYIIRRTRVYRNEKIEMDAVVGGKGKTSFEWRIQARPEKYKVVVSPHLPNWLAPFVKVVTSSVQWEIDVPEIVPEYAPTDVEAYPTGKLSETFIDFEPLPLSKIPGEDLGCRVQVCNEPDLASRCRSKGVEPRKATATFTDLALDTTYYATVACATNAGFGPYSEWISFRTGALRTRPPKRTTTEAQKTVPDVEIKIHVSTGMNTVISWGFNNKDGSTFTNKLIKHLQILQFRKSSKDASPDIAVVASDRTLRQIDIGISPGFKFDTSCYYYAINVTFQNDASDFKRTKEICYSFSSPGFLILYGAVVVLVSVIILVWFNKRGIARTKQAKTEEDLRSGDMKTKGTKLYQSQRKPIGRGRRKPT